ncbi:MAG: hypothetical protein UR69_C0002G0161 [Candidatus Moranbacteria bacterium GW2011_GWE2_35_2-]|nr:MAG: hypothetical protein UR69_C0002G0161 [Candidatus Moranbacteria bacterium GW2011_GWE2_35_2-]KKQ06762.1 MAG: hypothetical protein US15_C0004G0009 [Candidatus Moranbacteria bacterium GW2011_GWF1_36_4]KKQ30571.1 MAG: hypothetical protein US47_C0002G0161 [Candidatus Moranbacteria bacterium GW2011_GWE1_37_24]
MVFYYKSLVEHLYENASHIIIMREFFGIF